MSGDTGMLASIVGAVGTYRRASDQSRALRVQGETAAAQAYADEQAQRRDARQVMGAQAAAMAQAGGGAGGTNENVARQSAVAAELDALNIRYGGVTKRRALLAEAKSVKREGAYTAAGMLLAGASKSSANTAMKMLGG